MKILYTYFQIEKQQTIHLETSVWWLYITWFVHDYFGRDLVDKFYI